MSARAGDRARELGKRYQTLLENTPAPSDPSRPLTDETRALRIAAAFGYKIDPPSLRVKLIMESVLRELAEVRAEERTAMATEESFEKLASNNPERLDWKVETRGTGGNNSEDT